MANVCKRYVDAIYAGDKYASSLKELSLLYAGSEFKNLMDNPMITNDEKMSVIKEVIKQDDVFYNFVSLLLSEKRFNLIKEIYKEYEKLYMEENGVLKITITSADEISKEEVSKIIQKFKELYKASSVEYEFLIDKSLIGGVKVSAGDKVYDSSVRTRLDNILS